MRRDMLARGLAVAVAVVILDQLSKIAVLAFFAGRVLPQRMLSLTSFFDLVLTFNRGMSFGMFNNGPGLNAALFSLMAAVIVAVLLWWLSRVSHPFLAVAIGMIVGGAIGNVVDRLRFGAVVDFLYFHVGSWYWPAFNLADSAICLGVAAMLLDGLLLHREAQ
jgi:signal peptidase II